MKRILLIIALLAALTLSSCSILGGTQNGGNGAGSGNGSGSGTNQGGNTSGAPLVWNLETNIYFITEVTGVQRQTISTNFTELTGNVLSPYSDDKAQMEHELVIGPSSRPISQQAYHLLDRNMTDDDDAEGYVILVQDGSVAVAYSSDASYTAAMDAFYECCCVSSYYAENGPVYWDFYSLEVRAEQNREKMYAEGFAQLEEDLIRGGANNASEIVKGLRTFYTLIKTEQLYWLANLYDPETGAFYHCNSARDTLGYLPDLESTNQAFLMLDRGGLFKPVLGRVESGYGMHSLPESITKPLGEWVKSLQSPVDGMFYHPQWGTNIGDAEYGRDLSNAKTLLRIAGATPYYDDPTGTLKGSLGAPGPNAQPKPVAALSSRLAGSTITAVSAVVAASSTNTLPAYLQTLDAWKAYVDKFDVNGNGKSYPVGHALASQAFMIKSRGQEYVDYAINYLNEHQHADIGLWEYQNEVDYDPDDKVGYNGTNGLMKISSFYNGVGAPLPNAYNALQSVIKVGLYPNTVGKEETVCYTLNIWDCLSTTIGNTKKHDPDNYPAARQLLIDNLPEILKASYNVQSVHLREDGGFNYYETRSKKGFSKKVASGAPESDVDATMVATSSTLERMNNMFRTLFDGNITDVPFWCADDCYIFMNELLTRQNVEKNAAPEAKFIDFNDYVEADIVDGSEKQPDENINISLNTNFYSSTVVKRPGTTAADADLALRMESFVETEYDPDKNADMPLKDENGNYIQSASSALVNVFLGGFGNCYTVELDIMVESADLDQIFELYLVDSTQKAYQDQLTGYAFSTYRKNGEMYLKFYDYYAGADGTKNTNIYDKLKVGDWFSLRLEVYKEYVENEDESITTIVKVKVFIDDQFITITDCARVVDGKVVDFDPDTLQFSQYRNRASVVYFDNIMAEKKEISYEKEIVHNELTFDDGTIMSKPSIGVEVGTAAAGLVNDMVDKGESEGGNDRNYFKVRDDVEGKVGDAVLEIYHKADQKDSGYGASTINVGITDGSGSGQIFVLEFDMMLNLINGYTDKSNYFTRLRIGSSSNPVYHDFSSDGTNVFCINDAKRSTKEITLGAVGEWVHVKMIWHAFNLSTVDSATEHTTEYFFIITDAEGNEIVADHKSYYSSYTATNKSMTNIYLAGSENDSTFDQNYFLDNITFIRTEDASVLPARP